MATKKLIDPKAYKEFLQKYILDLYETDCLMLAGAVEGCLAHLEQQIASSEAAPLLDPSAHKAYLEQRIRRLQKVDDAFLVAAAVEKCLNELHKQPDATQQKSKVHPSCPYCGTKMVPVTRLKAHRSGVGVHWNSYFHCPSCFASSPKVEIDCNTDEEAISAACEAAMARNILAEEVVSREKYEAMRADRDSWKDAFAESNEKNALEVKRREAAEQENTRLRAIIVQHLPGDAVCKLCRFFPQCKKEALEDAPEAQQKSLFWTCDGYSHFADGED